MKGSHKGLMHSLSVHPSVCSLFIHSCHSLLLNRPVGTMLCGIGISGAVGLRSYLTITPHSVVWILTVFTALVDTAGSSQSWCVLLPGLCMPPCGGGSVEIPPWRWEPWACVLVCWCAIWPCMKLWDCGEAHKTFISLAWSNCALQEIPESCWDPAEACRSWTLWAGEKLVWFPPQTLPRRVAPCITTDKREYKRCLSVINQTRTRLFKP